MICTKIRRYLFILLTTYCTTLLIFNNQETLSYYLVPLNQKDIVIAQFKDNISFSYSFLHIPDNFCRRETKINIIILTLMKNNKIRDAIRSTWGNSSNWNQEVKDQVSLNFLASVNSPGFTLTSSLLYKENELHNDIIITNIVDTYEKLVLKVHSLLTVKNQYCSHSHFVVKVDEDVLLNVPELYQKLAKADANQFYGSIWNKSTPKRNRNNRWYVPKSLWEPKFFPKYCDGPMYVVGKDIINDILKTTKNNILWHIEDVYWTGIAAKQQNLTHTSWNKWRKNHGVLLKTCHNRSNPVIFSHSFKTPDEIRNGYRCLL